MKDSSRGSLLMLSALLAFAFANLTLGIASARETNPSIGPLLTLSRANALVLGASHGRARAISVFQGPDGLEGIVVALKSKKSTHSIIWATPNAKALLIGNLVDAKGQNLNEQAEVAQGLRLDPADALHIAAQTASMSTVTPGSGPILTFFIDPNCIFCNRLYRLIMPDVQAGRLRVRFVLVGIVKQDSPQRAESILSSSNRLQAIAHDEMDFDVALEEGGYPITDQPTSKAVAASAANDALMSRMGAVGTPTLLYCSKAADGRVEMLKGVPADFPRFVTDLASGPSPACHG